MLDFSMANQGVDGRQAQRKGSLQKVKVAKSLFLHFIMHVPWNYVIFIFFELCNF